MLYLVGLVRRCPQLRCRSMSAFSALIFVLYAWVAQAWAVDGHGVPLAPCAADIASSTVAWTPGLAEARTWTACATVEGAEKPVVALLTDGSGSRVYSPLDDLWGLHVGGTYGFGRVGVGLDVPLWLASRSDDVDQGGSMGDMRLYAPFSVVRPATATALAVDAVAELLIPTGDAGKLLGAGSLAAAAHLVVGQRGERLGGSVDFGVGYSDGDSLSGLDTSLWARLALAGDWRPVPRLVLGSELWFQASPLSEASFVQASPGEALLRVGGGITDRLWVSLAGGTAITPGVGAAQVRAYLRFGYSERPARAITPTIEAATSVSALPPGPWDVLISVRNDEGQPVDARVSWTGDVAPEPETVGDDGEGRSTLSPGRYVLSVSAEGYGEQRRGVDLADDRFRPERVTVILQRRQGDATLRLGVSDSEGRGVGAAIVTVDGKQFGQTSTSGTLEVDGVPSGDHSLVVAHPDFRAQGAREVQVPQAPGDTARIVLERPPGSVRVVTRGVSGPVPDARVRFSGPEEMAAQNIGPDGERTFTLLPGHWVMVASAADLGTQEREFEVEAGRTALVVIDVRLRVAEAGAGRLVVRVLDPAGGPVDGAEVLLDGESAGRTANGGTLTLAGLKGGARELAARGARFRDAPARTVELGEGTREVTLGLRWRAGQVHLIARGVEGAMVDARVRFSGPEELPPQNLGPDGEAWFELAPGTWTLAIASPTYGIQQRDVEVRPDDISLVEIGAGLLSDDGASTLALRVRSAQGGPLAEAVVTLDGKEIGTTASAGTIEIGGLRPGPHAVVISAPGHKVHASKVQLGDGRLEVTTTLLANGRRMDVLASSPVGPAVDAVVRGYGSGAGPPAPVDARGRREVTVEPGEWTLVAVSETYGIAQQDVSVAAGPSVLPLELRLAENAPARGALLVEIVDPAGNAVPNALLAVDGAAQSVGPTGLLLLPERAAGPVRLSVTAPGYRPYDDELLTLTGGSQTRRLRLEWLPRPVVVAVQDSRGRAVDAEVRVFGPGRAPPRQSGKQGASFALMPGAWQVVSSAAGFGPSRLDVVVPAGAEALHVEAVLGAGKVELTETSVVIRERVNFAFDKADIELGSYAVLEQVASTLLLHPDILHLEVRGHTDNRGTEVYNLDLSQRRADAVRAYLLRRGVDPGRVASRGFGATLPVGSNLTESGRAANRRVEFEIVDDAPATPPAP
jgi:outer membrane protein OmpA-like peptidoglycan-associated protein